VFNIGTLALPTASSITLLNRESEHAKLPTESLLPFTLTADRRH
jgi:hypothetical protein